MNAMVVVCQQPGNHRTMLLQLWLQVNIFQTSWALFVAGLCQKMYHKARNENHLWLIWDIDTDKWLQRF